MPWSLTEGGKGVDGVNFVCLLCPWLCANMGVQQLSWCTYTWDRGVAAQSEVCVGAEGLTGCVNRAWLPWELMAIDHPRCSNDRSYLELGLAMWDTCLRASVGAYLQCVIHTLSSNGFRFCAGRHRRNIQVAHNATAWVTHHHHLVCTIIVIDGRVSSRCSSPLCQLYTSGNEIQVLHVKRNFVFVVRGVTPF